MGVDASQMATFGAGVRRRALRIGAGGSAVLRKTAHDIERGAKAGAPVDTGALRNSISTTTSGSGRAGSMTAEVGPTVDYGIYVELGTSRMAPQPYLTPAFDAALSGFESAVEKLGGEILP